MRHASLGVRGGLDDDVIERGARRGHGDVVLFVDGAEIAQSPEHPFDLPLGLCRHQGLDDDASRLGLVRRGLALGELAANLAGHLVRAPLLLLGGGFSLASLGGSRPFALEGRFGVGNLLRLGLGQRDSRLSARLGLLEPSLRVLLLGREQVAFGDGDVHRSLGVRDLTLPRGQRGLSPLELGADGRHLPLEGLEHGVEGSLLLLNSGLQLSLLGLELGHLLLNRLALLRHVVALLGILGNLLIQLLRARLHVLEVLPVLDVLALKLGELFRGPVELALQLVQLDGVLLNDNLELLDSLVVLCGLCLFLLELCLELGDGFGNLGDVIPRILDVHLVRDCLVPEALALLGHEGLGFLPGVVEDVLLLLDELEAIDLAGALLVQLLQSFALLLDGLDVLVGADDVLEVFEEALVAGVRSLRLHHGDLLNLALEDEESVVVEVDAVMLEEVGDVGEVAGLLIDEVLGGVVAVGLARDDEVAVGHRLEVLALLIDDLVKVHLDARVLEVAEIGRVVDELGDLVQAELLGALAEDEEHRIDDVGLAASVGANHGGERLRGWRDDRGRRERAGKSRTRFLSPPAPPTRRRSRARFGASGAPSGALGRYRDPRTSRYDAASIERTGEVAGIARTLWKGPTCWAPA